ncbi:MAG: hypothetical protein WCL49_10850 [bacterium]
MCSFSSNSESVAWLGDKSFRVAIQPDGTLQSIEVGRADGVEAVKFREDEYRGPAWYDADGTVSLTPDTADPMLFTGTRHGLYYSLRYAVEQGKLVILATIRNEGKNALKGLHAGLRLGVDTSMEKFPDWNDRFFPTLLRCERTHFWGYLMTPRGRILGLGSPDPVASWHLDYKELQHRIFTLNLDLLHPGPVPARHPQDSGVLKAGQQRQWRIVLEDIPVLDEVKSRLAAITGAPMIDFDRYTIEVGRAPRVSYTGEVMDSTWRDEDGTIITLDEAIAKPGMYSLTVKGIGGKEAEALLTVRHPWSWYLKQARVEALAKPQKATSHTESWYGLFSCFLAQYHFADRALDEQAQAKFREIWPLMYDMGKMCPTSWHDRIQNHACAAGLMAARYRATGDIRDLEFAAALADFILTKQTPDGAYRNHATHYTSVIYIGKSLMEVMAEEQKLARTDPAWQVRYQRHEQSVRKAMDELVKNLDNIETEGEMTYEDGMIGCSAAQLALFALLQDDPAQRAKYRDAALHFSTGHRCLSQILIPDSRMNGGSLRFWEAQYDILTSPNMMNSPHGWSAWRIYALWYLYQLTGQVDYLRQVQNALGSCVQLIDGQTGELRWGFITDPFLEIQHFEEFPDKPGKGRCVRRVIGETYLPMISGWYQAPEGTWVTGYWGGDGGCCDNDVHEIFKCLEEVALTSAYIVEDPSGGVETWNCSVVRRGEAIEVTPAEPVVCRLHYNLRTACNVTVSFPGSHPITQSHQGIGWIES